MSVSNIVERILDASKWPCISNPENLELLNAMADSAFQLRTFEGMLSATLIYHQIIEAMCMHLLDDCYFQIQLSIYPSEIHFSVQAGKMLGYYISELKSSISFPHKDDFLNKVQEFNSCRIDIVHKMRRTNLEEFSRRLLLVKGMFDEIYGLYDAVQDNFRCIFHSFAKDTFIDYLDEI